MDAILSYHMNPRTCGVAKFNVGLAQRLDVPVRQIFEPKAISCREPLLSLKIVELHDGDVAHLNDLLDVVGWRDSYSLFLHDWTDTEIERRMVGEAREVFCGNSELASRMASIRPDVEALWCPGTLIDARRFNHAKIRVFTFGMAHKIRSRYYDRLKHLLEQTGKPYCLYVSTALHENTSFDEEFSVAFEELREMFGEHVHFLGYLSDSATYNYLIDTTFFVAFFDAGVRANNTTVNAAMECGAVVITNLDEHSPPSFTHMENVIDINECDALPDEPDVLDRIGSNASAVVDDSLGWRALVDRMRRDGDGSADPTASRVGRSTEFGGSAESGAPG